MNLGDKKLRKDLPAAWLRVHAAMGASRGALAREGARARDGEPLPARPPGPAVPHR